MTISLTSLPSNSLVQMDNTTKKTFRDMNPNNIDYFRTQLQNLSWHKIFNSPDVNSNLDLFWHKFRTLFNLNIPVKTTYFNKNIHKINNFMTKGLLISCNNKIHLDKISLSDQSNSNITTYKNYCNLYTVTVYFAAVKVLFWNQPQKSCKNPNKTWDQNQKWFK